MSDVRREVRAARNQALFREVNERIQELNRDFDHGSPVAELVCECCDAGCTERIGLTSEEYESIRADPTRFAVRDGHADPELDTVVEEGARFTVVEKRGAAAEYLGRIGARGAAARSRAAREVPPGV